MSKKKPKHDIIDDLILYMTIINNLDKNNTNKKKHL